MPLPGRFPLFIPNSQKWGCENRTNVQFSHPHFAKLGYALPGLSCSLPCLVYCLVRGRLGVMSDIEGARNRKKRLNLCGPHLRRIRQEKHLTLMDIQATLELDYG